MSTTASTSQCERGSLWFRRPVIALDDYFVRPGGVDVDAELACPLDLAAVARGFLVFSVTCGVARPVAFALLAVARGFALLCERGLFEGVGDAVGCGDCPEPEPLAGAAP